MKSKLIPVMLVIAALLCLLAMAWLGSPKGAHFTEAAGTNSAGLLVLVVSLMLPVLGFRSAKTQAVRALRALLSPVFIITLLPAAIMLAFCLDACLVRFPGHIFARDSQKVSIGMTRAEVIQNIGTFYFKAGNGNWETFSYFVQRPWGLDDKKFQVRFRDGKVVSAEFRSGLKADILTP